MTGGYQIIDLKNIDIDSAGGINTITVAGVYDLIEATRKPILITGIVIDGIEQHDAFAECKVSGSDFVLTTATRTYTVKADDTVTLGNA